MTTGKDVDIPNREYILDVLLYALSQRFRLFKMHLEPTGFTLNSLINTQKSFGKSNRRIYS